MLTRSRAYIRQHHVALIALCIAVIGVPTAYALTQNSVGSKQLKPGAVKGTDIAKNAVTGPKVKDGSLESSDFGSGELPAGPRGPDGPQGLQGVQGNDGPAGTGVNCRTNAPLPALTGGADVPICTMGPIRISGQCSTFGTDVAARLVYTTTVNDAVRVGDGDFDIVDSPGVDNNFFTTASVLNAPASATRDFAISVGANQLIGTAAAKVTKTAPDGTGNCEFRAFGG